MHLHKLIDQNWVFTILEGKDNSSKAVDIARELKLTWILLVDHDAFESNPGKTVLESRVGRILHKSKGDCVIKDTECPFHEDNDGLRGAIKKIKEVVKTAGIYAWKNNLESMVSLTKEGFSKNQWNTISFEERVDLVIELIEKENKEFMEFLKYLVRSCDNQ